MTSLNIFKDAAIMSKRLQTIKSLKYLSSDFALLILRDLNLCSGHYDKKHLAVDLAHLYGIKRIHKTYTRRDLIEDPLTYIWLRVIIQAIIDAKINRPCDIDLWYYDLPPGKQKCTNICHICSENAKTFLKNIDSKCETAVGLEAGTIEKYMFKIEKSQSGKTGSSYCMLDTN